jgi:hypothetical protein
LLSHSLVFSPSSRLLSRRKEDSQYSLLARVPW